MQHPSHTHGGTDRGVLVISEWPFQQVSDTCFYTTVKPAALKTRDFCLLSVQGPMRPSNLLATTAAKKDEYAWLSKVKTALEQSTMGGWISWSAYHADMHQAVLPPAVINALLPLFLDSANSVAMTRHSMDIINVAVQHLNPGQTPIFAADQPLYALAKKIQ